MSVLHLTITYKDGHIKECFITRFVKCIENFKYFYFEELSDSPGEGSTIALDKIENICVKVVT